MKSADLQLKIRSAYIWNIGLQLSKSLLGFGLSILLARFLEPKDYGLLGMVTVFIAILLVFQDCGLGQAIVYFREDKAALPTYFTVTAAAGIILTLVAFLAAPLVASFYHEPKLTIILRILSLTLLLASLRSVSQGILSKSFRFREVALVETGATLTAGIVGVWMAWHGFGVWSLVTNLVLSSAIQTAALCWMIPPRFTLTINRPVVKRVLVWSLPLTGSTLLWQFYDNSDYLLIGKLLGPVALGQYTLAFRLATIVNEKISSVINRVSFPSFAAMQDKPGEVVDHWFSITRKLALINFPLLTAVALNGGDFIAVVLGTKWLPAAAPLQFLCIVGALKTIMPIVSNLLSARGRTDILFAYTLVNTVCLPISFAVGCKLGSLVGVGIAWCVVYPFICLVLLVRATRVLNVRLRDYFANLAVPAMIAGVCLAGMLPVSWLLPGGITRLCVRSAIGLACFAACLSFRPGMRNEMRSLLTRTPLSVPAAVRPT